MQPPEYRNHPSAPNFAHLLYTTYPVSMFLIRSLPESDRIISEKNLQLQQLRYETMVAVLVVKFHKRFPGEDLTDLQEMVQRIPDWREKLLDLLGALQDRIKQTVLMTDEEVEEESVLLKEALRQLQERITATTGSR